MFSRVAGIFAACTLASGLLIPPNIDAASDSIHDLTFVSGDPKNQILELPCPTCAFVPKKSVEGIESENDTIWIQGGANNLILNFTISKDGSHLELNGQRIYRAGMQLSITNRDIHIDQVAASTSREQLESGDFRAVPLLITSSGTAFDEPTRVGTGEEMVGIRWRLLELEGQTIEVDEVDIQLLNLKGELLILSAEPQRAKAVHDPPAVDAGLRPFYGVDRHHGTRYRKCSMPAPICRFLRMLGSKVEDAKHIKIGKLTGCAGRKGGKPQRVPGNIRPHFEIYATPSESLHGPPFDHKSKPPGTSHGSPFRYARPSHHTHGPHGHHGPHGLHHRHHEFLRAVMHGFAYVIKTVLSTLAICLCVCAFTTFVADRFTVWFWIRVVRQGKKPTSEKSKRILAVFGYKEEAWFPVDEEAMALPMYEDAPPYELEGEQAELSEKQEMSVEEEQKVPLLDDRD